MKKVIDKSHGNILSFFRLVDELPDEFLFYVSKILAAECSSIMKDREQRDKAKRGRNTKHRQSRTHITDVIGKKKQR